MKTTLPGALDGEFVKLLLQRRFTRCTRPRTPPVYSSRAVVQKTTRSWLSSSLGSAERAQVEDEDAARESIVSHVDKRGSFADALSFATMSRLRIRSAFALDRHFAQFGIGLVSRASTIRNSLGPTRRRAGPCFANRGTY
jgi:hypothetical protein